ncbi:hypothetical protein NGUA11_03545 [Salmonella enterica]|nr:hypothetical protein NGUA11_03545 [Salmonella enterica]
MAWLVFLGDFSILPLFKSGKAGTAGAVPFANAFQYPASGLGISNSAHRFVSCSLLML